ncbi:uncharacterized protein ACIGJ3_006327 [Trichechus inunguis]
MKNLDILSRIWLKLGNAEIEDISMPVLEKELMQRELLTDHKYLETGCNSKKKRRKSSTRTCGLDLETETLNCSALKVTRSQHGMGRTWFWRIINWSSYVSFSFLTGHKQK